MHMHDDLKGKLRQLESNYSGKDFWSIVALVKKDKINDDELLEQIENISQKRFREKVHFTPQRPGRKPAGERCHDCCRGHGFSDKPGVDALLKRTYTYDNIASSFALCDRKPRWH